MSSIVVGTRGPTYVSAVSPITPALTGTVKYLCEGDSITRGRTQEGEHTWRSTIQSLMTTAAGTIGFPAFDFVGPQTFGDTADNQHNGISGSRAVDHNASVLIANVTTYTPDVVIYMIGTNDSPFGELDLSLQADALEAAYGVNNNLRFLWMSSTFRSDNATNEARIARFRSRMSQAADCLRGRGLKLLHIDTGSILGAGDLVDGLHPTAAGHDILGNAIWPTVRAVVGFA